jgi:hypothetical protein
LGATLEDVGGPEAPFETGAAGDDAGDDDAADPAAVLSEAGVAGAAEETAPGAGSALTVAPAVVASKPRARETALLALPRAVHEVSRRVATTSRTVKRCMFLQLRAGSAR